MGDRSCVVERPAVLAMARLRHEQSNQHNHCRRDDKKANNATRPAPLTLDGAIAQAGTTHNLHDRATGRQGYGNGG